MLSFYLFIYFSQRRGFCFFTARFSFGVRTELALVGAERARSLGRQPAAAGDRPGLLAVGLHTSEDTQYVFQNFPPSLVVPRLPQTLRPSGPWRRACEVPSFSHPGQHSSLSEKPPGNSLCGLRRVSKPVSEKPGSRVGLPPASHTAATEETFEPRSPARRDSCSGGCGLGSIFRARGGAICVRTAASAPPGFPSSGLGLSRPNPQPSATEARSPAEKNNLNLLRRNFPFRSP